LSKRTDNSQAFLKSVRPLENNLQEEEYVAKFYASPTFQKSGDKWYQIETATTTPVAFASQTKLTLLDHVKEFFGQPVLADTFYSGVGDGYVYISNVSTWAAAHDASIGSYAYPALTYAYVGAAYININDNPRYTINKIFLPFDTSAIPNNATVIDGTLRVYISGAILDTNTDSLDYLNIVQTNQPDSATLTTADYNNCGATTTPATGATAIDISNINPAGLVYVTFTLDSTGRGWIAKSGEPSSCGAIAGFTCLGIREGHDIENATTYTRVSQVQISTSEETAGAGGTDQDPLLTVTYIEIAPDVLKIDGGTLKIDGGTLKIN